MHATGRHLSFLIYGHTSKIAGRHLSSLIYGHTTVVKLHASQAFKAHRGKYLMEHTKNLVKAMYLKTVALEKTSTNMGTVVRIPVAADSV